MREDCMREVIKTVGTGMLFALVAVATAVGQSDSSEYKNQFGFTIGAEFIPDNSTLGPPSVPITFSSSVIFQLHYARLLKENENMALYFELPAAAAPSHDVQSSIPATTTSLATFYVTPGFRVNFKPRSRISPWVSFGGGYGLYEASENLSNGVENPSRDTNAGTLQFGAGLDYKTNLKIVRPISVRGEFRDFYTLDTVNFNTAVTTITQHNFTVGGGFYWRF